MRVTLITIRLSHFCEKARWALDKAQVPYTEVSHVPLVHRFYTRSHGGGTVPLLVAGKNVYEDSASILAYADSAAGGDVLYPSDIPMRREVQEWEEYFDRDLGPHVRRWLYAELLSKRELMIRLWSAGVSTAEARLAPLIYPIARGLVRRGYRISKSGVERSRGKVQQVFAKVDASLADGRRFLVNDQFSAADLSFAALAAPLLLPPQCPAELPPKESFPPALNAELSQLRECEAARFALRLYREERSVVGRSSANEA